MKIGVLTGGGDCPGLNAVIRAIVQRISLADGQCVGILDGWRGLVNFQFQPLDPSETDAIIGLGGTILGSSRYNPFKNPDDDLPKMQRTFDELELTGLVAIGGDDTLGVAYKMYSQYKIPIVGVPKTIDNDLMVTDVTFGFDTAINVVVEAVDRLRTTAESHRRIMVIETMGRHAGWIACFAGMAVGADYIMVPEVPVNLEHCIEVLRRRRADGKTHGIVLVSEGATFPNRGVVIAAEGVDAFGHVRLGGIGHHVAREIEDQIGVETRCVVLGHLQRGGPPSASDRVLATRLGLAAGDLVTKRRFGTMVALSGSRIIETTLNEGVAATKTLDLRYYDEASVFFGPGPHGPN